jgi:cytoskeleton protein RodZ
LTELTGIGAELRRARESQGLSVADVSQQLKFAPRQIESLESERFERLPGPTIARGMVRNYARLLNLEPEPLLERMAPKAEPPPDSSRRAARFNPQVPLSDGGRRSTLVYAGFSVAVLALVGVVAYEWQQERAAPQFVSPAQPQRPPQEPAPVPVPVPAPAPAQTAAATSPPQVASESPAPPVQEKAAEKPQPVIEKEKPVAGLHRIVLRCEEESWLEVTDGAGRSLVSALSPAGSERVVRGRAPLEIVIGNARGVTLLVDDKPVDLRRHTRADVARLTIK